jgi:hypothetical protein
MPDAPQAGDLEAVLAKLEQGWQELAELLRRRPQGRSRVLEAEKFVLVDANGGPRGRLEVKEDGACGLVLLDQEGKYRAWLGLKEDGSAYLTLKDRLGRICWETPQEPRGGGGEVASGPGAEPEPEVPALEVLERLEKLGANLAGLRELLKEGGQAEDRAKAPGQAGSTAAPPEPGRGEDVEVSRHLRRLERQTRGLRVWSGLLTAALLAALAGLGLLLAQLPKAGSPLTAPALTIHDPGGACRAWLGPRDGGLYLDLLDRNGKIRTTLGLDKEGDPLLQLYDRGHKLRAELGLNPEGEPGLSLVDQAGRLRVALGQVNPGYQVPADIRERPLSSLVIFNQEGVPIWRAPLYWRR